MAAMSTVKVAFLGDASDLAKAAKKASDSVEEVGKKAHGLRSVMAGLGGAALGAGLVEFGKKSFEAAVEGEQAQARLAQAVKNTGGNMEELEPKVAKLSSRFAKLGFTNDEVESALAGMTTSLGSSEKAMGAMGLAADLARTKHVDLSIASLAVAKAMEGNLRPLKQLGIDLPVAAGGALKLEQAHNGLAKAQDKVASVLKQFPDALNSASKHHAAYQAAVDKVRVAQDKLATVQDAAGAITKGLAAAIGGQATAASKTFAGQVAAMHAQLSNVTEQVGMKLLPVVMKAVTGFGRLASFFERNKRVLVPLATALGVIGTTLWVVVKATKAYTAVQEALDVVLAANPIGLVVVAVAALGLGMVLLWKKSQTFRTIVTAAFKAVGGVVLTLVDAWLGGFQLIAEGMSHLPFIGDKFKGVADGIGKVRDKIHQLKDDLDNLGKNVTRVPIVLDVTSPTGKAVQAAISAKRDRLDGARALGGPVAAGGAYLVGERGPEVFVPRQTGTIVPHGGAAGDGTLIVKLQLDSREVVQAIVRHPHAMPLLVTGVNRRNMRNNYNGSRMYG